MSADRDRRKSEMEAARVLRSTSAVLLVDLYRATALLVNASRVTPPLREAVATVESWLNDHRWRDYDMCQAWEAGAEWACEQLAVLDHDTVEGRDWAKESGRWLDDYQEEW